jgi:hypothetical protein
MVQINESGIEKLYQQVGERIAEIDRQSREQHEGEDAETLEPLAREAFGGIGMQLPDQSIKEYAAAVANRQGFEFRLQ